MKKTAIFLLCAVILFCPTVIAIANYLHVQFAPIGENDVERITVTDIDGTVTTYDRNESGQNADEVIALFFRLNSHKKEIPSVPVTVMEEQAYLVTVESNVKPDKPEDYKYYFSMDPSLCYMIGPGDKHYQLEPDDAAEFLSSDLAHGFYENSSLPKLMLSGKFEVAPREASWTYGNFRGDAIVSDTSGLVSSAEQNFTENVIFSLSYELEPDYFGIKVTDSSGEVLFDDQKSNLGSFTVDSEKTVHVEVTSKWYADESRSYSGEASYAFGAQLSPAPMFRLSADTVERGGFLTVTGKNVADNQSVTFSTDPEVEYYVSEQFNLKFWQDGDLVRAIIPIHPSLAAGEYRFTFTASGAEQSFLVNVTEPWCPDSAMYVTDEKADECLSEEAQKEFLALQKEITAEDSPLVQFEGSFLSGGERWWNNVPRGFGSLVLVNGGEKYSFYSNGIDVQYGWTAEVSALNNGTVVYTGETAFTGRLVVVEHGCGVRTWYWNLSDISVDVGAVVEKGSTVGHAGSTGLTDMNDGGVHLAMSVGACFVNPSLTWSVGISFPEFN